MPRKKTVPPSVIALGPIQVDRNQSACRIGEQEIHLRPKEALLLWTLMSRFNTVCSRAELMKAVWETDFAGDTRTLEVHMHSLRRKVELNTKQPEYLRTIRGQGYMFFYRNDADPKE